MNTVDDKRPDSDKVLDTILEAIPELDAEVSAALAKMTPTQRRRLTASLAGSTTSEIARQEGVKPQSVAETLRGYHVRGALRVIGDLIATTTVRFDGDTEDEPLLSKILDNLTKIAFGATRTVVAGSDTFKVPDFRLRMEASFKLLDLAVDAWKPSPAPTPDEPQAATESPSSSATVQTDELIARETTTVKREVRHRSRRSGGPGGAP
jgi:hypothetical protein